MMNRLFARIRSNPPAPQRTFSDLIHDIIFGYPGLIPVAIAVILYGTAIYSGHLKTFTEFFLVTLAVFLGWAAWFYFGKLSKI